MGGSDGDEEGKEDQDTEARKSATRNRIMTRKKRPIFWRVSMTRGRVIGWVMGVRLAGWDGARRVGSPERARRRVCSWYFQVRRRARRTR